MERKKIRKIHSFTVFGMLVSICLFCIAGYAAGGNLIIFLYGILVYGIVLFWFFLYAAALQRELGLFAKNVCDTMDKMQHGMEIAPCIWEEDSLFAHIGHRLVKLYHIMQQNREEIGKEKQKLLSLITDISHQVRTPMANLKLISETMLKHDRMPKNQQEVLCAMDLQLDKLNFLIDSMVKASRLETGIMELNRSSISLLETLAGAVGQIVMKAKEKRIEITVECSEELCAIHDRKWTEEVFFNILDNAVKYTPEHGRIQISAVSQELYARVDIADNGIGIAEKNHGAIFRRFYREREVHDFNGVGIGLYLARKIVSMQGGYILLRSKKGEGSCFSIYLPMKEI